MDQKTFAVIVGSMTAVAGLSYWSTRSRSASEFSPLSTREPEATFAGVSSVREIPLKASRLMAMDGSPVEVGDGLSLSRGVLSTRTRAPSAFGRDVFLL